MPLQLRDSWTAAYVSDLPDSAFLYIAPGGSKDADGKTVPRSKRYFPVKDANGKVDEPHVANALARIPQAASLTADARAAAMTKAKALAKSTSVSGGQGEYTGTAGSGRSRGYDVPNGALGLQERTFTLVMELRSTGDGHTLYGRAIPYGVAADVGGFRERFVPGVFSRQIGSGQVGQIKLYDAHTERLHGSHPIGRTTRLWDQPDGAYGEWQMFDTSRAEDSLKLVRAGEVTGLSVGFSAKDGGSRRGDDGVIERHAAHLDHVALTHEPIFADAQVLGVRSRLPEFEAERERYRQLVI